MTTKHARLVAAVSDAMQAQGFSQNNLARASGVSQSMISAAILGKYELKEEKWRLICETLALDYDEIIADIETTVEVKKAEPIEAVEETEATHGEGQTEVDEGSRVLLPVGNKTDIENLFLLAMYTEGRLAKDIEAGMKVDPMKLWGILDALKKNKGYHHELMHIH